MRNTLNLELELCLSSSDDQCPSSSSHPQSTNFYNGVMRVSDVTELQARAILCVANNEVRDVVAKTSPSPSASGSYDISSPGVNYSPVCSSGVAAGGVLSLKKSLKIFLQKRKRRSQATHPCHRRIIH